MALDTETGKKMLQLVTSRYNDRHWRKKIEKTLSLPPNGVGDDLQRAIFLYLKQGLKAYKSRRADADSWIVGGYATTETIQRAKFNPTVIAPHVAKQDVEFLATDPGPEVDEGWWEEMLVVWFEQPDDEAGTDEPAKTDENDETTAGERDDKRPSDVVSRQSRRLSDGEQSSS
jgi:hypothetical protein